MEEIKHKKIEKRRGNIMNQDNENEKNKNFLFQTYSNKNQKQNILILILMLILLLFIFCKPLYYTTYSQNTYDYYLINSLLDGKAYIDIEPSEELKNMENPYDFIERTTQKVDYLFDTAYYNGNYYVYFGIVPAVLLFIPYNLVTGEYMSVVQGTYIFLIASIIINILLSIKIYKKWFKQIPFGILFIFIIGNLISGLYIWNTWRIWNYELTLLAGFFFVQLGTFLIITATEKEKKDKERSLCTFLACFSMALAVGCRPNLMFTSILLLPFIYKIIKRKKTSTKIYFNCNTLFDCCYTINVV